MSNVELVQQVVQSANELTDTVRNWTQRIDQKVDNAIDHQAQLSQNARAQEKAAMEVFRSNAGHAMGQYTRKINVEGHANKFYPVLVTNDSPSPDIIRSGDQQGAVFRRRLSITRMLSDQRLPTSEEALADGIDYNGIHWMSMDFEMEWFNPGWGGGPELVSKIITNSYSYRRGIGTLRGDHSNSSHSRTIIWLRGKTGYNFSGNWNFNLSVLCTEDDEPVLVSASTGTRVGGRYLSSCYVSPVTELELERIEEFYKVGLGSTSEFNKLIRSNAEGRLPSEIGMHYQPTNVDPTNPMSSLDYYRTHRYFLPPKLTVFADAVGHGTFANASEYNKQRWLLEKHCRIVAGNTFPELHAEYYDESTQSYTRNPDLLRPEFRHILDMSIDDPTGLGE